MRLAPAEWLRTRHSTRVLLRLLEQTTLSLSTLYVINVEQLVLILST